MEKSCRARSIDWLECCTCGTLFVGELELRSRSWVVAGDRRGLPSQRSRGLDRPSGLERFLAREDDLDGVFPLHEFRPAWVDHDVSSSYVSHWVSLHVYHHHLVLFVCLFVWLFVDQSIKDSSYTE